MADMSDRLTVRGIDPALWRRARLAALHLDLTMGEAVNEALRVWLARIGMPAHERERNVASAQGHTDQPEELKS